MNVVIVGAFNVVLLQRLLVFVIDIGDFDPTGSERVNYTAFYLVAAAAAVI